jgi:hypothetical protein
MTTPLDTTRASAFSPVISGAGLSGGSGAYVSDDIIGAAQATLTVTNSTTVTLTRANTSLATNIAWQVVEWGGPRVWNSAYGWRRPLAVTATTAAPTGYTTSVTIDHAAMVTASMALASGDDIRIARWTGSAWSELDRVLDDGSSWNSSATKLWFKTAAAIAASTADQSYYLFYGNPAATSPPATKANVYLLSDGFESGSVTTNWTQQGGATSGWYNASWLYRKKLTVDNASVGTGGVTNFPLEVRLTADANVGAGARSDGFDIVFTSSNGTTALPYEREKFSVSGGNATAVMFFKAPALSTATDTDFYMYYGNASATDQALQNGGPTAVWDANFAAVYHLDEGVNTGVGFYQDSTSNARNGTYAGTPGLAVVDGTGQTGGALSFDGSNDVISTSDYADNGTALTVSAWIKPASTPSGPHDPVSKAGTWELQTDTGSQDASITTGTATYASSGTADSTSTLAAGTWYQMTTTYDASNLKVFRNGVQSMHVAKTGTTANTVAKVTIGAGDTTACCAFPGAVDEVRISLTDRGQGWATTEYNNTKSGSTFYTLGAQEAAAVANPFTAATDQVHGGTYSLKAATNTAGDDWIYANGLSAETGLRIDAYWRASSPGTLGAALGLRSGSTATENMYELSHLAAGGWQADKNVTGTVTSFSSVAEGTCLAANTWTKLSLLVQSNQVRAYCADSTGLVPAASWYTDAGSTFASGTAAILNRSLAAGQNWWVDDVTIRRLVNAEPVVTVGSAIFHDTLSSYSLTYSHDANLTVNATSPELHDNDSSRAVRNNTSSANIVWYQPGATGFRAVVDHWVTESVTNPTFAYSANGSAWTTQAATSTNLGGTSWLRYEYAYASLPAGTKYVRITLTGTAGQTWAQQLSRFEISY